MAEEGHTFGQRQPPLYVTIQKILDKYPDGQIFKEVIQNADDAGANTVHFYLDNRQHGTNSVISHNLDRFQGPSLLAYNDALFTDKDWQSIQDMQQSVKATDPFKVGKFGIGFNSVYHITDLPTILSGNRLAYLDPHEEIWQKETGQWYDIDKNKCYSDTFAAFENLCGFSIQTGTFAGTLFRFPLRNVQRVKGVSSHLYDIAKLHVLLSALREEAKCILLFLRSVRTIKVFEIAQNGMHSNVLEVSIHETSGDQLCLKRLQFKESLKKLFEKQSYSITQQLDEVVHVQVNVQDYVDSSNSSQSEWLVGNRVGSQIEEVKQLAEHLRVFPWVGVALETSLEKIECGGGRVFCVLPMPTEVSSKLPVHVNGTFSLNDERRELKWQGIERRNDQSAQWNHILVEKLIPPCYASLLLQHAKNLLQPQKFYEAWPNTNKVRGTHWEGLLSPLLTSLFSESVISFGKPGSPGIPLWVKVSLATFVPRGTSLPTEVTTALLACGVKLVSVTDAIWDALAFCGITVRSVSPSLTRSTLKISPGSYSEFSSHDKLVLLRYCLSDNSYIDMENLALLPLANGTFAVFGTQFSDPVYLCTGLCPRYLLPNLDGELVDDKLEGQIYQQLKAIADGEYANLKVLTVSTVASLLPRAMPQEWQDQNCIALSHSTFNMAWFERFWRWVPGEELALFSKQLLVPVFDSQTGAEGVMRLSLSLPSLFIPSTTNCSENLISALGRLGVKCCQQKRYQFIQHVTYLSSLMNYYSANGIVDAITHASPSYSNLSLSREEANCILAAVQGFTVTCQRVATLKSIPMFKTLSNTNERLYSVNQVEQLRSAQMEPLSFPLSSENLPSSVILFSSSDHHQKLLLQSLSVPCTSTTDLLIKVLFPLIEEGSMARNLSKKFMTEVLEKFDVINSDTNSQTRENFRSSISKLPFLSVSVGKPKALNTLFSPDSELKNLYYQEPVFPLEPFSSGQCLSILKSCGLKTRASSQEVADIISSISSPADTFPIQVDEIKHTRAKAILTYISKWVGPQLSESVYVHVRGCHRNMKFSDALKELSQNNSWLPVQSSPPPDYPSWLSWKGSGYTSHLVSFGSSVLLSKKQATYSFACGSQMFLVEHSLQEAICKVFSSLPVETMKHAMAHLGQVILRHSQCHDFEEVRNITHAIYQLLHIYQRAGYTVHLTMLQDTQECVWISKQKKFVHPHSIALEQNPSFRQNLEPFVYTLPGDLDRFASLFKALGVKDAVTKPQILGILETIKGGSSESLGVSNEQAWQLVMNILNWLTGSGEHLMEEYDCNSLFVPVEPDTEWPTLVKVNDVVYTDSMFLRQFLESSDCGEENFTFVNHRVSSQLAHQLRLTPLSTHLNISEDAFEDVGQNEPLTVRLKNILKDYKDGLTIVKEMLQNADDAGASEMNICYDTRYHAEKPESLFFPGMAECHGPALVANNNAMFTKEDFLNITKLAGATKKGEALKIGKFGVGFCSVYHITDIPSFVSDSFLYIFDPTLSYLKEEIKNPARPGKKICFTSSFISRSKQLAPYVGLFGFDSQSRYKGTTFRFPFRTAASELSGKIYTADDMTQLLEHIQVCSSKLLIFLRHIKSLTFSQIDHGQTACRELMNITKTTQSLGSRCICQISCSVRGSLSTNEYWLVETSTDTVLEKYSTASVACSLYPLPKSGEQCYRSQKIEGEMFCFLSLSITTGLPVHVSSNFAVSNNRRGIWTSDETSGMSEEVKWNESLMEGVISSAYCKLLERLKEMQINFTLKEYDFFSMWPLQVDVKVYNPWHLCVKMIYKSIEKLRLFFSVSTGKWLTIEDGRFLDSDILKVPHCSSIPSAVLDIVNHLQLPIVHLPAKYQEHLNLSASTETEEMFLKHFFANIDQLDSVMESRNKVLCFALQCYTNELDQQYSDRFCYLKKYLKANASIPCEPDGILLKKPDQLIHPHADFAELYDADETLFPLKEFCDKKLVDEAMKDLGVLHKYIPLHWLEERATRIAALYDSDPTKAMKRVKLIIECLFKEDQHERLTPESCTTIAGIAFLPVLPKPHDYPLPWKGDNQKLCSGNAILLKDVFQYMDDCTNMYIAGSQVVFLNQGPPSEGGCGVINPIMQEILQIKTDPSCTEVIAHFNVLIYVFNGSPEMIKWADCMSRKVYEFLDNLLKQGNVSSETMDTCISLLTCIWTGQGFVKSRYVAQNWSLSGPYLYKVPDSLITCKYLQKALKLKETFSIHDLVSVLLSLKTDFGTTPLPENCQSLVRAILPALPSQELEENYGTFMLPDSNFVMEDATKLFFNDMPWTSHDSNYTFLHPGVPLATAKVLGVQFCRTASLSRYSVTGSKFNVKKFGQHEELTRRIQNILRDYPFDVTILKELLQNADDARATKMHVILDMRTHSDQHLLSEEWRDLQGPALLVWNDSVFSEQDFEGIQHLGLGSKRSDSDTIGQYGIGFNAIYHLTDCPSFLTGGDTLCILDPHMRYVPEATDRHPGAMYGELDDKFWNTFDGLKSTYLRDELANQPKELLSGSLFRFPLRHTINLVQLSDIVRDLPGEVVISSHKMNDILKDWASQIKQSLLFLNSVRELKFSVIDDRLGTFSLMRSFKAERNEPQFNGQSDLVQKMKEFSQTREPYITTYALTIVESVMTEGGELREEWLIQQGIGDIQKKVESWSYVEQIKPRHGIAAPLKCDQIPLAGQVFCFLPLPLYSGLPVHINGHFILNSTRRNLWMPTDPEKEDERSCWNQNILQAIAASYAHFLERITEHFAKVEGLTGQATLETSARQYYTFFPGRTYKRADSSKRVPLSEPWLKLVKKVFEVMVERNSCILAVPTASNASLRQHKDKYLMHWHPLRNEQLPQSQVYFCKTTEDKRLRSILERIGIKITCAPLWIMNHFKEAKCNIPLLCRSSVFSFYTAFYKRVISDSFPCPIKDTPFTSIEDFKLFTEFLLIVGDECKGSSSNNVFPEEPFGYPLLLTADSQLRIFDIASKVLRSEYANLFPQCPERFLHKELCGLSYSCSYFVSASDNETVCVTAVKELLESVLPSECKNMCVSSGTEILKNVDIKMLWHCFSNDNVFKSVLGEVLKAWALLLARDNRLFRCVSDEQLLPIIPLSAAIPSVTYPSTTDVEVSTIVEHVLKAPFLDTSVVPIETVLPFCPQFSDPKRILKNLYYLNREFPFNEKISIQSAGVLVRYFAKIHLKKQMSCCQMMKTLPLFETIDGNVVPIEGKQVYVWPRNIYKGGSENWLEGTDLLFLSPFDNCLKLGVSKELGVVEISAEATYVHFIFPNFFKLNKDQRYGHLRHIQEYLFDTNFVNQRNSNWEISNPAVEFISALWDLPCIGDDDTSLQPICNFFTYKKEIFTTFPEHFKTLPKDIFPREERKVMNFFLKLGLQESVTQEKYLALCNDVANGKLERNTKTASRVLLDYLLSQGEAKLHGFHKDIRFLERVSQIAFVFPMHLPDLEWIFSVPQTSNRVVLSDEEIPLCKLSGSCLTASKELVWTVAPIIAVDISSSEPESVLKGLGIQIEPSGDDVMRNIKNLSRSCFAGERLFMKYSAPHCTKDGQSLINVFSSMLSFLQRVQEQVDVTELEMVPCIPVYTRPSQYPVLVEPSRVVCMDKEQTEPFYPFIHSIPDEIYVAKELLTGLGVKGSLHLKHMQIVLESLFISSDGLELEPNSIKMVTFAVKELNSLLSKNKESRKQSMHSMSEAAIAEALRPLYLSGIDRQMHPVTSLVYSRMKHVHVDLHGTNLYLLKIPRMMNIHAENFCKLLPAHLRPKALLELCSRKVSNSVELCGPTDCAASITQTLKIPALGVGMCTVVRHFLNGSKSREVVSEKFKENLHNFLQTLQICCVEHLMTDIVLNKDNIHKVIATESCKCFIQEQKSSYSLYLDSNVTAMNISDVRECIAETLVSWLKDAQLEEGECHHILKSLEYLLRANSSEDVYNYLREKDIHTDKLDDVMDVDIWNLKLGDCIPRSWHFRLDVNNNNIFRPQEYVGYEITDGEYIFAMVLHPVKLTDPAGQPLRPLHVKYKIIARDDLEGEEGKEVNASELSKFTMGRKSSEPDDATFDTAECHGTVSTEIDSENEPSIQDISQDLQQAKEEIRSELRDIQHLPELERRRAIRRLYLKWHPDKNQDNVELAEEAFKFLMNELDRLEKDEPESFSGVHSWRTHQDSWNSYAREQKQYSEQYTSQGTSSHRQQGNNEGNGRGGGGDDGFYFTPPKNVHEGLRWVRQAVADSEALETLLSDAQRNYRLSAHVCFMAHEVAEKALKGGMYTTCGLRDEFLKVHKIVPLAQSLDAEEPEKTAELIDLTSPLEPYYLETRFPNQCPVSTTPSEYYTLDQAEKAAECARGILKVVKDIVHYETAF